MPEEFVPWGSDTIMAIPQQLLARAKESVQEGQEAAILACFAFKNEQGNWEYRVTNNQMPSEVALMAAYEIKRHVVKGWVE